MKLLLDTHALLWWLIDDDRLGQRTRDWIVDPGHVVLISTVSLWEIVVKVRIGKLEADIAEISRAIGREGFDLLGLDPAHLETLAELPLYPDHRHPFDHLLIAQAIRESATFVSDNRNVARYPVTFVPCSDRRAPPAPP